MKNEEKQKKMKNEMLRFATADADRRIAEAILKKI
jgi:hypothetical protein